MIDNLVLDKSAASFAIRRSSPERLTAGDFSGSTSEEQREPYENGKRSKYISIDAAKILFEEQRDRTSLYAIPFKRATLARPRWTLQVIYDSGLRRILQSRSRNSRPIYANAPSGVYGIAAEIGAEQVILCMPDS